MFTNKWPDMSSKRGRQFGPQPAGPEWRVNVKDVIKFDSIISTTLRLASWYMSLTRGGTFGNNVTEHPPKLEPNLTVRLAHKYGFDGRKLAGKERTRRRETIKCSLFEHSFISSTVMLHWPIVWHSPLRVGKIPSQQQCKLLFSKQELPHGIPKNGTADTLLCVYRHFTSATESTNRSPPPSPAGLQRYILFNCALLRRVPALCLLRLAW